MIRPRYELSDAQWATIREVRPPSGRRGTQWKDHRLVIDGILWALSYGGRWRNVPDRFGPWEAVSERFRRWPRPGVWDDPLSELQVRKAVVGGIDWERFAIGGSVIRAHQSAAGASTETVPEGEPAGQALGRSPGGFGTRLRLVAAIGGGPVLPLVFESRPGQPHETQRVVPLVEALDEKGMRPEELAGDKGCSAKWIRA